MDSKDLKYIIDNDNVVRDLIYEAFTRVVDNIRATVYKKAETIMYQKVLKEFSNDSIKASVDNDFQTFQLTCAAVKRQPFNPSRSILVYYHSEHEEKLEKRRALAPNDTTAVVLADDNTFEDFRPISDEQYRSRQKADELENEKIVQFSKEIEEEFMRKLEARTYRLSEACPKPYHSDHEDKLEKRRALAPNDKTAVVLADDNRFEEFRPISDDQYRRRQKADKLENETIVQFSKAIEDEFMRKLEARKSRMKALTKRTSVDNEYKYEIATTHIASDENIKATANDPISDDESNLPGDDCSVVRTKDINYLLHQVNDTDTQIFKEINLESVEVGIRNDEGRTAKYTDVGMDCSKEADELDLADEINGKPEKKKRKQFRKVRKLCSRLFGRKIRKYYRDDPSSNL